MAWQPKQGEQVIHLVYEERYYRELIMVSISNESSDWIRVRSPGEKELQTLSRASVFPLSMKPELDDLITDLKREDEVKRENLGRLFELVNVKARM